MRHLQVGEKYGLTAEQVQVVYECYFKTFAKCVKEEKDVVVSIPRFCRFYMNNKRRAHILRLMALKKERLEQERMTADVSQ